jgi:hypothetical protein
MESAPDNLSSEDRKALCQLEQKASNLRQSSSNHFLVSLEGLMLSAIAWESIGKISKYKWISPLSKVTTAIGLAVTGIFAVSALNDRAKAMKIDAKLKKYGMDELTLPCEIKSASPMHSALHPHQAHKPGHHHPHTTIQPGDREVSMLQDTPEKQIGA